MPGQGISQDLFEYFVRKTDNKIEELESHLDNRFDRHERKFDEQFQSFRELFEEHRRELENLKLLRARMVGASMAISVVVSIAGWAIGLAFGTH